jgi:CheY-like chemotaxis protein
MRRRLLIAESDNALLEQHRVYFTRLGFDVAIASTGLSCLEMLERHHPHALVLERNLTWGGGDGVVDYMRRDHRLSSIAVVVISDGSQADGETQCREALYPPPVVARFEKPVRMNCLFDVLNEEVAADETDESPADDWEFVPDACEALSERCVR